MLKVINTSQRSFRSLSGEWASRIEPIEGLASDVKEKTRKVPGFFFHEGGYADLRYYEGVLCLERFFEVDNRDKSRRIVLRFESIAHHAQVFVNDKQVVVNRGGYLPFEVAINDVVRIGKNKITVRLTNILDEGSLPVGNFHKSSGGVSGVVNERFSLDPDPAGILGDVFLYTTPWFYIEEIKTGYFEENGQAFLKIEVKTVGPYHTLEISLKDAEGRLVAKAEGDLVVLAIPNPILWEFGRPYHYCLDIVSYSEEGMCDFYCLEVALNESLWQERKMPLNEKIDGKPMVWPSQSVLPTMPGACSFLEKWWGEKDDLQVIDMGTYPALPEVLDLCDALGIGVVMGICPDIPRTGIWEDGLTHRENTLESMIFRMVKRDRNHACILAWKLPVLAGSDKIKNIKKGIGQLDGWQRPTVT